eukprot:TRINITY_DN11671_c0_g1_i2.p1 TRINITY_DN11671_c0_g1~~TRINITY_DN11671_c0_g1_i2.p1  ORF type:complete len:473 (+),score=88.91 TRINITY_DN11671_c0_g1_i2:128-1546(+)
MKNLRLLRNFCSKKVVGHSPFELLSRRHSVMQTSSSQLNDKDFTKLLKAVHNKRDVCAYAGFDPTAASLHVGNLFTIVSLVRLSAAGINPIFVIGGATARVGDPSGRSSEREKLDDNVTLRNINSIRFFFDEAIESLSNYFSKHSDMAGKYDIRGAKVINNAEYYADVNLVDFLSNIGRHFRMSTLLSRESVAARLASPEGLSFTEFSYQLFQAYDYMRLHQDHNCFLQLGGSDQWGNIVGGIDLVKRTHGTEVFGITIPLLTTSSGEKLGKSAGNAVWLSRDRNRNDELYHYLINISDDDVERLLYQLTFLSEEEILATMEAHAKAPEKKVAQQLLATTIVEMLGLSSNANEFVLSAQKLFQTDISTLQGKTHDEIRAFFADVRNKKAFSKPNTTSAEMNLVEFLFRQAVRSSKRELRRLFSSGAILINGEKVLLDDALSKHVTSFLLADSYLVVRLGKKEFHVFEDKKSP